MLCRICDGTTIENQRLDEVIHGHNSLRGEPHKHKTIDLALFFCPQCHHYQTEYILGEEFYDNYSQFAFGSTKYYGSVNEVQRRRAENLARLSKPSDILVDIGCGSGHFFDFTEAFSRCVGFDPSVAEIDAGLREGKELYPAYFSIEALEEAGIRDISAIYSSQVFEHLEKPRKILLDAFAMMRPGGGGLINVPNGGLIVANGDFTQLLSEHINYYSVQSLSTLLTRCGFEVLWTEALDDLLEIDVYFRKPHDAESFTEQKNRLSRELKAALDGCGNITIWGAGLRTAHYSQLLDGMRVRHLVDSSPSKTGAFASGIDCAIELASAEVIRNSDAIVVFATTYNNEILRDLKEKYAYEGRIIFFDAHRVRVDQLVRNV